MFVCLFVCDTCEGNDSSFKAGLTCILPRSVSASDPSRLLEGDVATGHGARHQPAPVQDHYTHRVVNLIIHNIFIIFFVIRIAESLASIVSSITLAKGRVPFKQFSGCGSVIASHLVIHVKIICLLLQPLVVLNFVQTAAVSRHPVRLALPLGVGSGAG